MSESTVYIRDLQVTDEQEFLSAASRSHALHTPWVKAPTNPVAFAGFLARPVERNASFLVCRASDEAIVGCINVSEIVRGCFLSAYLGYYAFAPYEHRGYMRQGLPLLLTHTFTKLSLHRLEANVQPGNLASIALLKSCGFEREGLSKGYLRIDGEWRDHERWALRAEGWTPTLVGR